MDLKLRIIHARDFLKLTPTGEVEFEASKRSLLEIASLNALPSQHDLLIDTRHKTGFLTLTEIAELVDALLENRELFRSKLAILAKPGQGLDNAKFAELYATNRGFRVAAFTEFEDVMTWLTNTAELTAESGSELTSGTTGEAA
jgi:hypothetical protein